MNGDLQGKQSMNVIARDLVREESRLHRILRLPYTTTAATTTPHPIIAREPPDNERGTDIPQSAHAGALHSVSSTSQSKSSAHDTVSSNRELRSSANVSSSPASPSSSSTPSPLSSTPSSESSSPPSVSSTSYAEIPTLAFFSSTPYSLGSASSTLSPNHRPPGPFPPTLSSAHHPFQPTSRPLGTAPSDHASLSSSSTHPSPIPTAEMIIPTSPSLDALELVSTAHIPSTRPRPTPGPSGNDTAPQGVPRGTPNATTVPTPAASTTVTPSGMRTSLRGREDPPPTQAPPTPTAAHPSSTPGSTPGARETKRRPAKTSRDHRTSPPGGVAAEEDGGSIHRARQSPRVDPYKDGCANDPCGPGIACHPTPGNEYPFVCICSEDEKRIRPGQTCSTNPVVLDLPPKPVDPEVSKTTKNVVGPTVVGAVLVMVLLLFVYWRRKSFYSLTRHRQGEKKSAQQQSPGTLAKSTSLLPYNCASNPNYYAQSPDNLPLQTLAVQLIDSEQITFIGELGEGCFGKVYKGTYGPRCPENLGVVEGGEPGREGAVSLTVAVKVLKECAGMEAEADFLREVENMSAFRHDNILSLIGIVVTETGGTPWMVFEYMPYGDLAEVLRSCNKQFYSNDSPIKSLSKEDLLTISVQIASGMEYLSLQHFVHRDLACRNCLVGDNYTVKISDFGMSRDVYTCDYYKVGGSRMLPVRWMAPESIMYGKFTLESDVWSFGVVLWEIYSFGKQPYYGNSNENVVKLIFQGILLSPPDTCPPQVCDVMRRCWATDPNDRLKFPDILSHLKRLRQDHKAGSRPTSTSSSSSSSPSAPPAVPPPPITYSELCPQDEGGLQLDSDQYLMPRKAEYREYLTVLNDV